MTTRFSSQLTRFRALTFLSVTCLISTVIAQRLQLIRGAPWYTGPFFHPNDPPGDVSSDCLSTLAYQGLGDLKSVICQSRLENPYSASIPSTQTPIFLLLHKIVSQIPISYAIFFFLTIILLFTLFLSAHLSPNSRYRLALTISLSSIPILYAFERGNFIYGVFPIIIIFAHHLSQPSIELDQIRKTPDWVISGSLISLMASVKPTMILISLLGIGRRPRHSLAVILTASALSMFANILVGLILYDVSNYVHAVRYWQSPSFTFPHNLYSVNPSSILSITSSLNIERLTPTRLLNLFAFTAPLCIFVMLNANLWRVRATRSQRFQTWKESRTSGDLDVATSLYVASVLALLATGAPYQATAPITFLAIQLTERRAPRHLGWQLGFLIALLLSVVGPHRALLAFSPFLASILHTILVLVLWMIPSLFCLKVVFFGDVKGDACDGRLAARISKSKVESCWGRNKLERGLTRHH